MKMRLRGGRLKHIDVEGTRAVTNNKSSAEQIQSDKVENVATGGVQIGEFGKLAKVKI